MSRRRGPAERRSVPTPAFDAEVLPEPRILFGGRHEHVDPKIGLALYGPYSGPDQPRPPLSSINVGIVGPAPMLADAERFLHAATGELVNDGSQPFLHPHFPGFNAAPPFQCALVLAASLRHAFTSDELTAALKTPDFYDRIDKIAALYVRAIETLEARDPRPSVVLCCIPQEVIDVCTVRRTRAGQIQRIKLTSEEKRAREEAASPQLRLFAELGTTVGVEDEEPVHQNLRRAIKADSMKFGIPTQLVWPRTLELVPRTAAVGERQVQDIATRAWNLLTALYYKAGGSPWRLAQIDPGVCFIGVSFYREILTTEPKLRTALAQMFTASGDGYVIRGKAFEWDEATGGRSPHLDQANAASLMRDVLALYKRQNEDRLPSRLVLHKSSRFTEEELRGFKDGAGSVPRMDLVAFGWRGIQFHRPGLYPPLRGMYVRFDDRNFLLYTVGYVPYLRTYPGAATPQPIEILEHHGDSPWDVVLNESLALTKMNWNTSDFACAKPMTLAFAQRVGHILAEMREGETPRPEYRYYM